MDAQGIVFAIERCSLHDGPGIRTTVFFKGCPLRCLWCHNPESQSPDPQLYYLHEQCSGCRACEKACARGSHQFAPTHVIDRSACDTCGQCAQACPHHALEIKGAVMTTSQVLAEVEKDAAFYAASGGGLTVSGGEPLAQLEFLLLLLSAAKKLGIHTCVETCGMAPAEALQQVAPLVDLFLYDWKASDDCLHRQFTGASNRQIAANLDLLASLGASVILRCPLVPGLNDDEAHLAAIACLGLENPSIRHIELMPFHAMGAVKALRVGSRSQLPDKLNATEEDKNRWLTAIRRCGYAAVRIS